MVRQTIQNIYLAFGENSAKIYSVDDETASGKWESKFSISALDIQASALIGLASGTAAGVLGDSDL